MINSLKMNYRLREVSLLSYRTRNAFRTITSLPENKLFDKILIANRGEIACRIIRTTKRLGIKSVAVYSDVDANSEHVKLADEAVYIGGSPVSESYLLGAKIIDACKRTNAQAVHPGYGFLSENLSFCQLCKDNGIVFIGPPPFAISAMGSKSESKDIMIKAGVPVTPGYHGTDNSDQRLLKEATRIGFPVMIKAVAGGGGKGMRAVIDESKFLDSLESCRRECLKAFGDDAVLIEKLVLNPRHVELQIFGDMLGNVVHLLERDCSIQRRHQKVFEEAPVHSLDASVRKAMSNAAVACAKAVGYVGAGTVEFLVDSVTNDFYFCEMNTRLQVEHPVTEMITHVDLVEWQLRVASGQPIPLSQEQIIHQSSGCAIEARIYAENPQNDFLPTSGKINWIHPPNLDGASFEDGVRVDSGVITGNTVSTFYDPMIAKLIVHAETRPKALEKLERALRNFQVAGLANNIDFLIKVVRHPGFTKSIANTGFFGMHMNDILNSLHSKDNTIVSNHHLKFGICMYLDSLRINTGSGLWSGESEDLLDWRNQRSRLKSLTVISSNESINILTESTTSDDIIMHIKNETNKNIAIALKMKSKQLLSRDKSSSTVWKSTIEIDGSLKSGTVCISTNSTNQTKVVDVWLDGCIREESTHYQFTIAPTDYLLKGELTKVPVAYSPMPGKIIQIIAKQGCEVKQGDPLVILEAMKMEHPVLAPNTGTVNIFCEVGAIVSEGTKLAEVLSKI